MRYLHSMVRVKDLDASLFFYCELLGLKEYRRHDSEVGRFTLVYLGPEGCEEPPIELTYNWPASGDASEDYGNARNFGHLAFGVDDIYALCETFQKAGVVINRPPRDGRMAFILSPDNISIELLQNGAALEIVEPWKSMKNIGSW